MLSEEIVSDLPPSTKLVLKVLEHNGELIQTEIVEKSRLPQTTVRHSLNRLQVAGVVEENLCLQDARQKLYRLTEEKETSTMVEAE